MKISASIAALLVVLPVSSVFAADLPSRKEPVGAPVVAPMWTGFYAGLNAGGTWANRSYQIASAPYYLGSTNTGPNPSGNPDYSAAAILGIAGSQSANSLGFIGGGQFGYNYQFAGSFLAGVEADIQGIAGNGSGGSYWRNTSVLGENLFHHNYLSNVSVSSNLDYLGTVRGRVGYLITPTALVYGTGGLAYGGVNLSYTGSQIGYNHNQDYATISPGYKAVNQTQVGWTAGGGVEWMFMSNWSAKAEYLYYDLGSVTTATGYTIAAKVRGVDPQINLINSSQASSRFNGNIARLGVNYHFNFSAAPAVIAAKY